MALLGADTDELREVGKEFEEGKEITDDVIKFLQALIIALKAAAFFSGGASAAYAEYLETTVLPWLQKISQALGLFAQVLNGQAQQQDDASNGNVSTGTVPSYTPAAGLPAPVTPFTGGSIAGGTPSTDGSVPTGAGSGTTTATTGTAGPTTTTGTTATPGGLSTPTSTGTTGTAASNPMTGTPSAGTTAGAMTGATTAPHWGIDSNGHVVFDTGIDTNGPDATTGTTTAAAPATAPAHLGATSIGSGSALQTGHLSNAVPGALQHGGTLHESALPAAGGAGALGGGSHGGGGGGSLGGGSSLGSALGGGSGSSLGGGSIDGTGGSGSVLGGSSDVPVSHSQPLSDGGLGGATPGAVSAGHATMGAASNPVPAATGGAPSYGAAAGIAGGAAALGLGGAAMAAKAGSGAGGSDPKIDSLGTSNGRGSTGEGVKELQQKLTSAGYDTQGSDGVWGRNTEAAYDAYRADHPLPVQAGSGYAAPDGYDYTKITGVKGNPNVTPEFLRGLEGMSQRLGAKPEHILAAMSFETGGTFSPSVKNAHSSATGLIQFMDSTAKGLGTTTHDLSQMTPAQQLPYVEQYFQPYRGRLGDLESVYTSILAGHPASGDTALFTQGHQSYTVNAGLDSNRDGVVTAAEAAAKVRARMGD